MFVKGLIITSALLASFASYANSAPLRHEATFSEYQYATQLNQKIFQFHRLSDEPLAAHSPIEDDAKFSYVLLSAENYGLSEVEELRKQIALNLPKNVKLVVLTSTYSASQIRQTYSKWIDSNRLIIATDSSWSNSNGFWARDSFPIPVKSKADESDISLIAHQYYRPFSSFKAIADSVSAKYKVRDEVFVGGNLLTDVDGNCFTVNSRRLFDMTPEAVERVYGCSTMTVFEHITGIGDIDEVIKPLGNKIMLTNQPSYVSRLEDLGYKVIQLPNLKGTYRTHVNSLLVEDIAFMPVYGIPEDETAKKVYESLGYKVVSIPSNYLSDMLHGSVHCQTMAYPQIEKNKLFQNLNIVELE